MWRWLTGWIHDLPDWLKPAAIGALVLALGAVSRVVFFLPRQFAQPNAILAAFGAVVLSAAGGALAGFAYSLVGSRLRDVPIFGPYLAGIFTVAAYTLAMFAIFWFAFPDMPPSDRDTFDLRNQESLVIWGGVTVFYGLLVGQFWFRRRG